MDFLNIQIPNNKKIAVISDIHQHLDQFNKIIAEIQKIDNVIIVSVGDICAKGFGIEAEEKIINTLIDLGKKNLAYTVKGNNEIKAVKLAKQNGKMTPQMMWADALPLGLSFVFENKSRVSVVHGGILPHHSFNDLKTNTDVCYVRYINKDGKMVADEKKNDSGVITWHEMYDGRYGFMISGHLAQRDGIPKFYKYSANLDTACYATGILTAQVVGSNGLEQLITVKGKAKQGQDIFL